MDCLNIYLALVSTARPRVGRRSSFFSNKVFTLHLERLASTHKWIFLFYKVHSSTPWPSGKILKVSALHLRVPLRLFTFVCPMFSGGGAKAGLEVLSGSFQRYRLWSSGLTNPSITMSLWQSHIFYSLLKGTQKFSWGLLCDGEWHPGKSYTCLPVSSSCNEEGICGISYSLSGGIYLCSHLYSLSMSKRRLNIGNRRRILLLLFGFFITNLPCHIVTLQNAISVS